MSGMIEPRAPSPGWERRWLREAAGLVLQAPLAVILVLAGIVVCGLLINLDTGLPLGISTFLMMIATFYCGSLAVCLASRALGESEGYVDRVLDWAPVLRVFRASFPIFFGLSALTGFAAGSAEMLIDLSQTVPEPAPERSFMSVILGDGADYVMSAVILSSFYGFVCIPCMTMLDVTYDQGITLTMRAANICGPMIVRAYAVMIPLALFVDSLPFWFSVPATVLLVFWVYVAGREIFGGVTGNKQRQRSFSLKEA